MEKRRMGLVCDIRVYSAREKRYPQRVNATLNNTERNEGDYSID